jgi:hypothetical protein
MAEILNLWMPISKSIDGKWNAILSDTSLDRDEELMAPELIKRWATTKALPALINHENRMEKLVGGWENISYVENGEHAALVANPWFFPAEVSLSADEIRKKIQYAADKGVNVGISISAIPHEHITKKIGDKSYKVWTDAELIEATWVPIQSNRNATYIKMAKSFDLHKEEKMEKQNIAMEELSNTGIPEKEEEKVPEAIQKPAELDECVEALMNDPDFKPQEGRTKEESAYAVCQSRLKEKCPCQDKMRTKDISEVEKFTKLLNEEKENMKKEIEKLNEKILSLERAKKDSDDKLNAIIKAPTQDAINADSIKKQNPVDAFVKAYYGEK